MTSIAVSEFRANLNSVLDAVKKGARIELTSRGKTVAVISPAESSQLKSQEMLVALRKTAILGDVLSPIDEHWTAEHDNA